MSNRGSSSHDEGVMLVGEIAGKLEDAGRPVGEDVKPLEAAVVQRCPIGFARKRQDGVKLEAELKRDIRRDLVGAVGKRRDEQQARRRLGEVAAFARVQVERARLQLLQRGADPLDDRLDRFFLQRLDPVAGDADTKDERKARRVDALRSRFDLQSKLARFAVQLFFQALPMTTPRITRITAAAMAIAAD